jgi:hypothetical protein
MKSEVFQAELGRMLHLHSVAMGRNELIGGSESLPR